MSTTDVQPAIHDIGYQRYAGPRLGRGYIWRSLAVDGLRGSFGLGRSAGSKVWPWLLLTLATLPTVIIVVVASLTAGLTGDGLAVSPAQYVSRILILVVIFVAVLAPRAVSRDLRYRTVPLYLSRPLSRVDYVTAKLAAMAAAVFVLTAVPVTVLSFGALLVELPWRDTLVDWLVGLLVAVLASVVLAAVGVAIAAWTPRRGLGTAVVVGYFIVAAGVVVAFTELSIAQGRDGLADYAQALSPTETVAAIASWLDGTPLDATGMTVDATAGVAMLGVWAFTVLLALLTLVLRYRKVSAS